MGLDSSQGRVWLLKLVKARGGINTTLHIQLIRGPTSDPPGAVQARN